MPNLTSFHQKLATRINPNLTAEESTQCIIVAALESEYGQTFTAQPGFAKMVRALGQAIINHPNLRKQALAITSLYLEKYENTQSPV